MMVETDFSEKLLSFRRYYLSEKGKGDLLKLEKDISIAKRRLHLLLKEDFSNYSDTTLYSIGGKTLHRGIISPDLLKKIILSKTEKGKLLKTRSKNSSFSYDFYNGRLISVSALEKGTILSRERLFYKKNAIFGITFSPAGECIGFSEELFKENFLIRYSYYEIKDGEVVSVRKTVFGYEKGKTTKAYELKMHSDGSIFRSDYVFHRTAGGYLRSYSVFDFSENGEALRNGSPFPLPPYLEF